MILHTAQAPNQLMVLEMVSDILGATEPSELGAKLTDQLRELTGAKTAILITFGEQSGHRVIHTSPSRHAGIFTSQELNFFYLHRSENLSRFTDELPEHHPIRTTLDRAGIRSILKFPLNAGGECVGMMVLLNLPVYEAEDGEIGRFEQDAVKIITLLSSPIALALKNLMTLTRIEEQARELTEANARLILAREMADSANRAKTTFLSTMSHELRTPLNAILGFSEILGRSPLLEHEQQEHISIIRKSGEHLLSIINDILDLSKIESGQMELEPQTIDLGQMLADLAAMLEVKAKSKGLTLEIDQTSSFPRFVRIDPGKLRQIIVNLAGNAIKYTETGGITIKLCTNACQDKKDSYHIIGEVTDTGAGIAPENLERILEPFIQLTQCEGTGLGLTITRQLCQIMNGNLSVSSELGKGSTFRFEVSYEPAETERILETFDSSVIESIPNASDFRILIVEDQFENRLLIHKLLAPFGFQIREAENGLDGVELFEEWHPDLILMDRRMPEMDGLKATKIIRSMDQYEQPVIIAVTAHAFQEERQEMLDAGCDAFLRKPFDARHLYSIIGSNLALRINFSNNSAHTIQNYDPEVLSIQLPEEVIHALIAAAESYAPMEFKEILSPYPDVLYSLKPWIENFKFNELTSILKKKID